MPYKHLNKEDRGDIEALLKIGESQSRIAKQLGVNRSTVSREIRRNGNLQPNESITLKRANKPAILQEDCRHFRGSGKAQEKFRALEAYQKRKVIHSKEVSRKYNRAEADQKATGRRAAANSLRTILSPETNNLLENYVLHRLTDERWSPEQIAGRLKRIYGVSISPSTIYSYIYRKENKKKLTPFLRHHGNKYRRKRGTNKRIEKQRKDARLSIHDRPVAADLRSRIGDLEGDTIVGLDPTDRILTHNDRATGECRLRLVLG
jgi:IS30 family transposase